MAVTMGCIVYMHVYLPVLFILNIDNYFVMLQEIM